MSGIDLIKEKIMSDVKTQIHELEKHSEIKLKKIASKLEEEKAIFQAEKAKIKANLEEVQQRKLESLKRLEKRKVYLNEKMSFVNQILLDSEETLMEVDNTIMAELISKSLVQHTFKHSVKIALSPRRHKKGANEVMALVAKSLPKGHMPVELIAEPGKFRGGFMIIDGPYEYNYTFCAMIDANRDELKQLVMDIVGL